MEKIEDIITLIDSHEKKEMKNTFLKYLRKWPWFVVFCIVGTMFGYLYYKNSPNTYKVASRILIKREDNSLKSLLSFNNPMMPMVKKSNIENQIGILKSFTLYRKALSNLEWGHSWYRKELLYDAELYNNDPFNLIVPPNGINAEMLPLEVVALSENKYSVKAKGETRVNGYLQEVDFEEIVRFNEPFVNEFFNFTLNYRNGRIGENYILKFNNLNALTGRYLGKTNIDELEVGSDLILISIEGNVPQKEAEFINELNNVFIQFGMENKNASSEKSVEFIDSQISRLKNTLTSAEKKYSQYRQNNQVMNLGQEAQVVYARLEEIDQERYYLNLQIDYYKDLQQYLDNSQKIQDMINPSIIGIDDANLNTMLASLRNLYSRRVLLLESVQEKNPALIAVEKEIKITRDQLDETLRNQIKLSESQIESMNERYAEIQARLKKLPDTEKELISIQRDFDLNNELYTYMLQKKAEASISKASIDSEVQVIDEALVEASYRTGPNMILHVGGGMFAGFIIPFVFITLLSFFNNKIETREEIEKGSKIPVLEGIIKHKYKVQLPVIHHPRSGIAESFRGLKSNLNAILEKPGSKVVSINSLIPGEGKSFISSNFSAVLTKSKKKVLLVGADLHKPTLHNFLGVKESCGLSDYFKDDKTIEEIISKTSLPGLSFIQSGPIPQNPSDLLDRVKFEKLIDQARNIFDYIIIDNAPLLLVPDAVLTSSFSDVSLFLLRINHSHKEQIKQINKIVDFNKIKRSAIVINEAPDRGYGYGNKYWKKGYGEYKHKMSIA